MLDVDGYVLCNRAKTDCQVATSPLFAECQILTLGIVTVTGRAAVIAMSC